jgi:hypothetical protein
MSSIKANLGLQHSVACVRSSELEGGVVTFVRIAFHVMVGADFFAVLELMCRWGPSFKWLRRFRHSQHTPLA